MNIPYLDSTFLDNHCEYLNLILQLENGFTSETLLTPKRHHHNYSGHNTLLLMPSWQLNKDIGVKLISVNPQNSEKKLPTINGTYVYLDFETGIPKAIIDAPSLTSIRTAATSLLASKFLARPSSNKMLMIGTGRLSKTLIKAYTAFFPIDQVFVWGRNKQNAERIRDHFTNGENAFDIKVIDKIEEQIKTVDIVSAATYSETPLILGHQLSEGQHIDLVGAYKPNMRESDSEVMSRGMVFVDDFESAVSESGDISIPISEKTIDKSDIKGDLFGLCRKKCEGRLNEQDITVFKSVGHGLEDLIAARYFYDRYIESTKQKN